MPEAFLTVYPFDLTDVEYRLIYAARPTYPRGHLMLLFITREVLRGAIRGRLRDTVWEGVDRIQRAGTYVPARVVYSERLRYPLGQPLK